MTTTPNPTADQVAGEISEARRWIELHESNKYQREAAKRMKRLVSILEALTAAGMLVGDPTEEQIERVTAIINSVYGNQIADTGAVARAALAAAGVAPREMKGSEHVLQGGCRDAVGSDDRGDRASDQSGNSDRVCTPGMGALV